MAKLTLENGKEFKDTQAINTIMAALNVKLADWKTATTPLLAKPALEDAEKEALLKAHDHYFEKLKQDFGYEARDMIVLHPDIPNLDAMLKKFITCHTHDDDEVRYIVDGEGIFGFVMPDGSQAELLVEAGDYINVPMNTEHWFRLTPKKRIKAIRYFTNMDGWTPVYTNTKIRIGDLADA